MQSCHRTLRLVIRFEKQLPGHRVQTDVKFIEPIVGTTGRKSGRNKYYQFTAIATTAPSCGCYGFTRPSTRRPRASSSTMSSNACCSRPRSFRTMVLSSNQRSSGTSWTRATPAHISNPAQTYRQTGEGPPGRCGETGPELVQQNLGGPGYRCTWKHRLLTSTRGESDTIDTFVRSWSNHAFAPADTARCCWLLNRSSLMACSFM